MQPTAPAFDPASLLPDPQVLAQLRQAVLADPAELDALAAQSDRELVIERLHALAARLDPAISVEQLRLALSADPLGLHLFDQRPVNAVHRLGPQWMPVGLGSDGAQLVIDWAHFGGAPLDEPFFEGNLRRARSHPVSTLLRLRTPLGALLDDPAFADPPAPDGIVFHMSRCGSTLVAQALGTLDGAVTLSEPPPFDALLLELSGRTELDLALKCRLLRAMFAALASDRTGDTRRRFLKTDCWHAGTLPLLRAAWPDTPWIFLFRDPLAVLQSHDVRPGSQTLPGPHAAMVGLDPAGEIPSMDFTARVLAATCHAAADHAALGGGLFLDYAELPGAIVTRILPHFGITPTAAELAALAQATRRDAKQPGIPFDPASRPAPQQASAELREAAQRHLGPALERLRALAAAPAD